MLLRVFALILALLATAPIGDVSAWDDRPDIVSATSPAGVSNAGTTPTEDTINEFYPEKRSLGDCLSSLPKPDCGSDARGGWRQSLILVAILTGLAFIAWRIVLQSRKARS